MPIIDVHAHYTADVYKDVVRAGGLWHGLGPKTGELNHPGFSMSVAERIAQMDADGCDLQLVTPTTGFSQYGNEIKTAIEINRDCNDAIAQMVADHPTRFAGLGTLPMQDVPSAIAELDRVMGELRLKGVLVSDHVNGQTWDDPKFLPFFKRLEEHGALVFFHQAGDTVVRSRISRYGLPNAVGNLTERTLTFAALVFGGVMDACPNLKVLLAHGGGYATFGAGRLDKAAGAFEGEYAKSGKLTPPSKRSDSDFVLKRPPSTYLSQFYYDCITYDERALRYIIDTVGVDRVMLGTDCPAPMFLIDAVNWINSLTSLTAAEKSAILSGNAEMLLGL